MRHVASRLGRAQCPLFHYVPDKEDSYDLLQDAAIIEIVVPTRASGEWRADLHMLAMLGAPALNGSPGLSVLGSTVRHSRRTTGAQSEFSLAPVAGLKFDGQIIYRSSPSFLKLHGGLRHSGPRPCQTRNAAGAHWQRMAKPTREHEGSQRPRVPPNQTSVVPRQRAARRWCRIRRWSQTSSTTGLRS